jgi:hypothetical protein
MFESGISTQRTQELNAVATRGLGVLEKAAEDLLESAIGVYLRGLGLIPPDS